MEVDKIVIEVLWNLKDKNNRIKKLLTENSFESPNALNAAMHAISNEEVIKAREEVYRRIYLKS